MSSHNNLNQIKHAENKVDALLSLASPFVGDVNDDIPILDILIGAGSKPGWFKASVAIYLNDDTLKASSEHISPNAALNRALEYLAQKIALHVQSKNHFQKLVRKTLHTKRLPKPEHV